MVLCEDCNGASDDILACKPKLETYFWDIGKGHYWIPWVEYKRQAAQQKLMNSLQRWRYCLKYMQELVKN